MPRLARTLALIAPFVLATSLFAADEPWDRFVREVVTARGSTLQNGAANYFATS